MWDLIQSGYNGLVGSMTNNQFMSGAVTLWALGVITWLCRNVPLALWSAIKRQILTSLVFNNAGYTDNRRQFTAFMAWFGASRWAKWSRYMAMVGDEGEDYETTAVVGPGFGTHFFMYQGWPFWFIKSKLESSGANVEKHEITIYTLGRRQDRIKNLIEDFRYRPRGDRIAVYQLGNGSHGHWDELDRILPRPLNTVIIPAQVKQELVGTLDHYFENRQWYLDRGMNYKKTFVIHGPPGTGKTSVIKALASHYNRSVYQLNLNDVSDRMLQMAVSRIPKGAFLLIEDFDSNSVTHSRGEMQTERTSKGGLVMTSTKESGETSMEQLYGVTISGLLNTLDGIVSLDDLVIFMTTNYIEKIDAALIRKGRVDHCVELGYLGDDEVRAYIALMYPGTPIPQDVVFADSKGCDLQARFLEYRDDATRFIDSLEIVDNAPVTTLKRA